MKMRMAAGLVLGLMMGVSAIAQGVPQTYMPRLGDIMGATQLRHIKLAFAGKLRNWELAAYELEQIDASFQDAAMLYPGIPVTDMTIVGPPVKALRESIAARDGAGFDQAFGALTNACNGCHQSIGRSFIVIKVPTASSFSNQVFAPK